MKLFNPNSLIKFCKCIEEFIANDNCSNVTIMEQNCVDKLSSTIPFMREECEDLLCISSLLFETFNGCQPTMTIELCRTIENIWIQYCNACMVLFTTNTRLDYPNLQNSFEEVIGRELLEKILCNDSKCISSEYQELLEALPCFLQLDLRLGI